MKRTLVLTLLLFLAVVSYLAYAEAEGTRKMSDYDIDDSGRKGAGDRLGGVGGKGEKRRGPVRVLDIDDENIVLTLRRFVCLPYSCVC
jgi:hypothetical protein